MYKEILGNKRDARRVEDLARTLALKDEEARSEAHYYFEKKPVGPLPKEN